LIKTAPKAPILYTGGLENHSALLQSLCAERTVLGITGNTLSNLRNTPGFYNLLKSKQINTPAIITRTKDLKNETDSKIAKEPSPDLSAVLKSKSIYYNVDNKKNVRLAYSDRDLIQNKIGEEDLAQKSIVSPIDISLTIDGFSGFRAGQCFHVDGVPEIYNKIGMFQITNIKHNITNEDGWSTTVEASLRVGLS
jgi:hypothetical protein